MEPTFSDKEQAQINHLIKEGYSEKDAIQFVLANRPEGFYW